MYGTGPLACRVWSHPRPPRSGLAIHPSWVTPPHTHPDTQLQHPQPHSARTACSASYSCWTTSASSADASERCRALQVLAARGSAHGAPQGSRPRAHTQRGFHGAPSCWLSPTLARPVCISCPPAARRGGVRWWPTTLHIRRAAWRASSLALLLRWRRGCCKPAACRWPVPRTTTTPTRRLQPYSLQCARWAGLQAAWRPQCKARG